MTDSLTKPLIDLTANYSLIPKLASGCHQDKVIQFFMHQYVFQSDYLLQDEFSPGYLIKVLDFKVRRLKLSAENNFWLVQILHKRMRHVWHIF